MEDDTRNSGSQDGDATDTPAGTPDLRCFGPHQSVILVADDEVLIRNLVTLLLQQDGHMVLSAANGREGLEIAREYPGPIELVITDAQMPQMNGTCVPTCSS